MQRRPFKRQNNYRRPRSFRSLSDTEPVLDRLRLCGAFRLASLSFERDEDERERELEELESEPELESESESESESEELDVSEPLDESELLPEPRLAFFLDLLASLSLPSCTALSFSLASNILFAVPLFCLNSSGTSTLGFPSALSFANRDGFSSNCVRDGRDTYGRVDLQS